MMLTLLIAAASAFAFACAGTPLVRALALRLNIIDRPNHRSSHDRPTARAGGVAILVAVTMSLLVARQLLNLSPYLLAAAFLVAIVGLTDDVVGLRAKPRLLLQIAAAVAVTVGSGATVATLDLPLVGSIPFGWIAVPLTVFWIVGVTNAYNFMDGINGIASLQAVAAGIALAVLFARHGDLGAATLCVAIASAAAGFLPWNFPKASIFMGDVASGALGFLFSALVVRACVLGATFIEAALVLLPFCLDAGITLLRRIAAREAFLEAHRSHFYQRLNRLGWTHTRVSLLWFTLAVVCAVAAVRYSSASRSVQLSMLLIVAGLHVLVAVSITRAERLPASVPGNTPAS